MLARDIVVMDRADAETLADEAGRLLAILRSAERIAYNATDDRTRTIYADLRDALGCARWLAGGITEALA